MNSSKEIIRLIKNIRSEKSMSLDALSKKVGMAKSTLSRYESGERNFPINDIGKFASALDTTVEYLLGLGESKYRTSNYTYIPNTISAGLPVISEAVAEYETESITLPDSLMGKWAGHSDIFVIKINGDSMDKLMPSGSIIAVKPTNLLDLKNGDIVVFSENHEYSVKRYFKHGNSIVFKPESNDQEFYDQTYTTDDGIEIHGKVVLYIVELD